MKLKKLFENSILLEMPNLTKKITGFEYFIYVSTKDNVKGAHGPRIKVSNIAGKFEPNDNFSIVISKEPYVVAGTCKIKKSELEDILDWVKVNEKILMAWWNSKGDEEARDALLLVQKV